MNGCDSKKHFHNPAWKIPTIYERESKKLVFFSTVALQLLLQLCRSLSRLQYVCSFNSVAYIHSTRTHTISPQFFYYCSKVLCEWTCQQHLSLLFRGKKIYMKSWKMSAHTNSATSPSNSPTSVRRAWAFYKKKRKLLLLMLVWTNLVLTFSLFLSPHSFPLLSPFTNNITTSLHLTENANKALLEWF